VAGIGPVVRDGETLDDGVIPIVDEREVEEIGERIGGDDLVAFDIRAAKPTVVFAGPEKLRAGLAALPRVKRAVIIIHQGVIPGIGLESLVPIIDFPGLFFFPPCRL